MARRKLTTRQFVRMSQVLMDEGHLEDRSPGDMTDAELLREWRRAFGKDAAVPGDDVHRRGNLTGAERLALAHFDAAAERSERSIYAARDALDRLADASDEYERRDALVDVVESLMDGSYALGMAEGHLLQAGRRDPMKVPRFRQLVGLLADTWEGARARRIANFTDRGRAAIAAGLTSVAGAVLGGALLGPAGALAGSVVGGAAGPYAFMREHRDPEELGDAVLGGGVGGLFTPLGALVGAYVAGEELARVSNPMATATEMRDSVERWLKDENLWSREISFWTPDRWNESEEGRKRLAAWGAEHALRDGFVVVAEGTRFTHALAYGDSPDDTEIVHGWQKLLQDNGWASNPTAVWAVHVFPVQTALERSTNPGARRRPNRKVKLPKRGDEPLIIESHGRELVVKPGDQRGEWVSKVGTRVRWGTRRETLEDIEHFEYMGMLPPASPGTWANQKRKRNGWIGEVSAVHHYLSTVGADQGEDDRYIIGGDPPIYGLGGDEIVISDDTVYYADGRPVPLAAAMATTSSGVPVKVFNKGRVRNMDADTAVDRINDALTDKDWVEFEDASEDLFEWIRRGGSPPSRTVDWRYLDRAYRGGDVDERSYEWLLDINKRSVGELPLAERLRNC